MKSSFLTSVVVVFELVSLTLQQTAVDESTTWKYAKYCDPDPTYELDELKVEQMFKDMHPDLAKLHWKEAETMTPEKLASICHEVLVDITPSDRNLKERYHYAVYNPATFEYTRFVKNAAVLFQKDTEHFVYMTLLKCVFVEMDIFLAQGNATHVFRMDRNPDNTFEFRTGLHPVNYNV